MRLKPMPNAGLCANQRFPENIKNAVTIKVITAFSVIYEKYYLKSIGTQPAVPSLIL